MVWTMSTIRIYNGRSKDQINYTKIDVDQDQEFSIKYGVRNIPTLILLENGEVKNKLVGNQTVQSIMSFYNG
jgi:thioredoxin 1